METVKRKFSGTKIVICASLYMFFSQGLIASWVIPYSSYFPEYYNTDITVLSLGVSICTGMGFLTNLMAAPVIRKLQGRGCMALGAMLNIIWPLLFACSTSLVTYFIAWFVIGLGLGFTAHAAVQHLIVQWFYDKRSSMIGLAMGAAWFGNAIFQFLIGVLLPRVGVSRSFIYLMIPSVLVSGLMAFMVRSKPEDIGQTALGYENDPANTAGDMGNDAASERSSGEKVSMKNLYNNPGFWLFLVVMVFFCINCGAVTAYGTAFFPSVGLSFETASLLVSVLNFVNSILVMFALGPMIEKIGPKKTAIIAMGSALLCNIILLFQNGSTSTALLALTVLFCAGGVCCNSLCHVMTPGLFGAKYSTEADTKAMAVLSGSGVIVNPIYAALLSNIGFSGMWIFSAVADIVGILLIIVLFAVMQKHPIEDETEMTG